MTTNLTAAPALQRPTRARYGVLAFCCVLSMITYLDRVCFGTVAPTIPAELGLSKTQLGWVFTAFALAYAAFEVPTGWLGDVFGARVTLIRIVLWWSAFTALTGAIYPTPTVPWLAFTLLFAVRFLFGIGEAGAYPNISRAFANWFPFGERGSAQGAVWMAGRFMGGLSPLLTLTLMYQVTAADGTEVTHWRHIFWIFGAIGVVWCVLFWWWFRDRPEEHPSANAAEVAVIHGGAASAHAGHREVPWGKLLTDGNLWVLCLMYFGCAYGWYFNITWLPSYLKDEYGIRKEDAFWTFSLLAGMPLLLGSLACLFGGLLTDWFIRTTGNRNLGRRLFGAIGHSACAVCFFLALTADTAYLFVMWIALAAFCNDLTMGSAWASCIDIGGKYAGIVSGCMNTIGNLGGAVAGVTTGLVLDYYKSRNGLEEGQPNPDGWAVNILSYGLVYVAAVVLWLNFDATRMVAQSTGEGGLKLDLAGAAPDGPRLPAPPSEEIKRPGDVTK